MKLKTLKNNEQTKWHVSLLQIKQMFQFLILLSIMFGIASCGTWVGSPQDDNEEDSKLIAKASNTDSTEIDSENESDKGVVVNRPDEAQEDSVGDSASIVSVEITHLGGDWCSEATATVESTPEGTESSIIIVSEIFESDADYSVSFKETDGTLIESAVNFSGRTDVIVEIVWTGQSEICEVQITLNEMADDKTVKLELP